MDSNPSVPLAHPTAHAFDGEAAATAVITLLAPATLFGLGTTCQTSPFQCKISVCGTLPGLIA